MFKLLPEEQKKLVKREYYLRIITTSLFLLLLATILASAFLYPIGILSSYKVKVARETLDSGQADEILSGENSLGPVLKTAKDELDMLNQFQPAVSWYLLLGRLINEKPKGVVINHFDLAKGKTVNELLIKFSGLSDSREALLSLVKNLERQSIFSKIILPVSDLTKNKDIVFSLTTTVTF